MADISINDVRRPAVTTADATSPLPGSGQSEPTISSATLPPDTVTFAELEALAEAAQAQEAEQPEENVQEAVTRLNDFVQTLDRDISFQADDSTGQTIVTVSDRATGEIIRQIPDDVALRLAQNLQQEEPISLFNITV